ncbi:Hypothetical protein BURPS1710b_1109 [Burkholderia pseudomallei 1710b]|uniref:Uncharacterized protein n=1 Tax=Burkholderia pseudomallei (strain 1710b) TaxID=320372 RepID=Q3JV83_BURP1|nr:Hypothetical protein BURPS1710b_1109 [Burkholderia pseudomallei 1710b]
MQARATRQAARPPAARRRRPARKRARAPACRAAREPARASCPACRPCLPCLPCPACRPSLGLRQTRRARKATRRPPPARSKGNVCATSIDSRVVEAEVPTIHQSARTLHFACGQRAHARHQNETPRRPRGPPGCRSTSAMPMRLLHVFDQHLTEARARHLRRAFHQAREVVRDALLLDRLLHRGNDHVGRFGPAEVAQHHFGRQDFRTRVHVILARVLRRRAVRRFEHRDRIRQVRARRDADAADLRGERVRDVVAVQVQRRDHVVFGRAQQDLLQERVGDRILDHDLVARLRVLELHPRAAVDQLGAEFLLRERIAGVTERTFRELHDVALVDERDRLAVVVDRVLDRLAHEALGAFLRHGLDADARGLREADLLHAHLFLQELDDLLRLLGFGRPFDAGVDVFRVLAEDDHVGLLRLAHGRRHALEVLDRAQADVQVELLTQRDVQRADAAADRGRERPLDRHDVFLQHLQRLFRQPHVRAVDLRRLLAGVDLHPVNLLLAAVRLLDRRVDDLDHHRRDVEARAVALDVRDDRLIGNVEREILVDGDLVTAFRNLDVLIRHDRLQ